MLEDDVIMDLFSLSRLIGFSGEISKRLINFSTKIDEAPSSIRSMGYEISSTADVLSELHNLLRRQQSERISSFSQSAINDLEEAVEKCDEIVYEVARGVLVAHRRMNKCPRIDGKVVLGIQERAQWPLFQLRLYSLISELSTAKMDIVLYLLVLQVRAERFYSKSHESVLFASLSQGQREEIIARVWQAKSQIKQESSFGNSDYRSVAGIQPTRPMGLQHLRSMGASTQGYSSEDDNGSVVAPRRGRSFFTRLFSRSNSKNSSRSPTAAQARSDSAHSRGETPSRMSSQTRSIGRSSSSGARSMSDLSSATSSGRSHASSASRSSASSSNTETSLHKKVSLLSITNPVPIVPMESAPWIAKRSMMQHGPTMSAKRGIEQEWESFRLLEEWQLLDGSEQQRLGHQLLLGQLLSKIDTASHDALPANVTVEMLVTRWTTVPRRETVASSSQVPPTWQIQGHMGGSSSHTTPERHYGMNERMMLPRGATTLPMQADLVRKETSPPFTYRRQVTA